MIGTASQSANNQIGNRSRADYALLLLLSTAVLALDCATKTWARRHLSGFLDSVDPSGPVTLALEQNHAGAFGLMAGANQTLTRIIFTSISLVSVVAVIWLYWRLKPQRSALKWGLPLVLGGALGNLLDRVRFGHVLDFVDVHVLFLGIQRHMSRFNLADVAITLGVGLMAIDLLRRQRAGAAANEQAPGSAWPTRRMQ